MKYKYTPITKEKKGNPFCKMTRQDHEILERQLMEIQHFICQLGSSTDPLHMKFYECMSSERNAKHFGKSGEYSWNPNTPLAALSGAVQKLSKGDMSLRQIENITPILELVHQVFPRKFSKIEFEAVSEDEILTDFEKLFDA